MTNLDSILKSRDITLPTKVQLVKAMFFPVVIYGRESWTKKKAECQRIDAFELWCWRRLESPLDWKEIKPVNPKGNQSWIFIGRTDAEGETPILWPPDWKKWLSGKDPDAGKDWRWEEKGTTENKMVGWHHQLDGHKFEHTPGFGAGQGSLACCSPWGHKESDMTKWLNLIKLKQYTHIPICRIHTHTHTHTHTHFPSISSGKEPSCQCRRHKRHRLGRSPIGGHGSLLQYYWLENPVDRKSWWATVHRVAKSQTQLKWLSMQHTCMYSDVFASIITLWSWYQTKPSIGPNTKSQKALVVSKPSTYF